MAQTEQLLGWHFNAPALNQPVRFATADEYQHLRREGLVEHLLSEGSLPDDKPKPLDRPAMSIRLKQPGQETVLVNDGGSVRVSGQSAELELEIRGLATDQVGAVACRVGDGQPARLAPLSRQVWSTALTDLPRQRKPLQIQLTVTTAEVEPQDFREQFSIEYRPPSPEIAELRPAAEHAIVKDAALTVAALCAIARKRFGRRGSAIDAYRRIKTGGNETVGGPGPIDRRTSHRTTARR